MAGRHTGWILLAVALVAGLLLRGTPAAQTATGPAGLAEPREGLTYDATVDPTSRAAIETAIASARPEAQALLAKVAGYTTITVGRPEGEALGSAGGGVDGRFEVIVNLGEMQRSAGSRGIMRLVLHELGHVVDFMLVDDDLAARLDAMVPEGVPCPPGTELGACAPDEERFAETFAKWAMGNDLGIDIYSGYAVPPPTSFEAWAAEVVGLAE